MSVEFIGHVFPHQFSETIDHEGEFWGEPLAAATGAAGNSTALVGTQQLISGYKPYADAVAYGDVIALVRERALVAA